MGSSQVGCFTFATLVEFSIILPPSTILPGVLYNNTATTLLAGAGFCLGFQCQLFKLHIPEAHD